MIVFTQHADGSLGCSFEIQPPLSGWQSVNGMKILCNGDLVAEIVVKDGNPHVVYEGKEAQL